MATGALGYTIVYKAKKVKYFQEIDIKYVEISEYVILANRT